MPIKGNEVSSFLHPISNEHIEVLGSHSFFLLVLLGLIREFGIFPSTRDINLYYPCN